MEKCPGWTACTQTMSLQTKQHPKSVVTELCVGYRWREKWRAAVREETEWESVFESWFVNGSWNVTANGCVEFLFSYNRFDILFSPVWNIHYNPKFLYRYNKAISKNLGTFCVCTCTYKNTLSYVSFLYWAQTLRDSKRRFEVI